MISKEILNINKTLKISNSKNDIKQNEKDYLKAFLFKNNMGIL